MISCFLIVSLIIFFAGYERNVGEWNSNSVATTCNITRVYTVPAARYTYSCDCFSDCSSGQCVQRCGSCSDHYHNGWIDLIYEKNYTKSILIYDFGSHHEPEPNKIIEEISKTHPVGSEHPCYYQKNNIGDLKLLWNYGFEYLIPVALLGATVVAIAIAWIVLHLLDRHEVPLPQEVEGSIELPTYSA